MSRPGRRTTAGQLSVLMDIGGELRPARDLGFPCIVVAWAAGSGANWQAEFQDFWPKEAIEATISSNRLFIHKDSEANVSMKKAHWFYVVPLTSVHDLAAMRRLIVNPVLALVNDETVEATFANAPEVLRFSNDAGQVSLRPS